MQHVPAMMQLDGPDEDLVFPRTPRNPFESLNFHPTFSSPEANVVLAAKEAQVYFRLHSHTLKTTSGFFKEMYSLPQ